jgi:DNA-binding MarR family transcriptional regulator
VLAPWGERRSFGAESFKSERFDAESFRGERFRPVGLPRCFIPLRSRHAMPSSRQPSKRPAAGQTAVTRIEAACRSAVAGKLAVRDLARWVAGFGVSETEFRLLWVLHHAAELAQKFESSTRRPAAALAQTELASQLAASTAQVSAVVERLRAMGLVDHDVQTGDRRRQLWQLAPAGRALVAAIVAAVEALPPCSASPAGKAEKDAA